MDPEALLAATFSLGRRDPRLFDEVLDWLLKNGDLIQVGRLYTLIRQYAFARSEQPMAAVSCILGREARLRQRWRLGRARSVAMDPGKEEVFFLLENGQPLPTPATPDPDFLKFGFLRERFESRGLSGVFPAAGSATLLLQLRALFGLSSRCELLCLLLTRPSVSGSEAAQLTGYAARTVQEALADMGRTSVITSWPMGKEIRYSRRSGSSFPGMPLSPSEAPPRFPPAPAILAAVERMVDAAARCARQDAPPAASTAIMRRDLQAAARMLALAGMPVAFSASLEASSREFLATLLGESHQLLKELGG